MGLKNEGGHKKTLLRKKDDYSTQDPDRLRDFLDFPRNL